MKAAKLIGAVFTACLLAGCTKTTKWSEDVQLNTGEILTVHRAAKRRPPILPDAGGSRLGQVLEIKPGVRWEGTGYEVPLSLEVIDDAPTLVFYVGYAKACHQSGATLPVQIVQFRSHEWITLSERDVDLGDRKINFLGRVWGGDSQYDVRGHLTTSQKEGRDRDVGKPLIAHMTSTRSTCELLKMTMHSHE